MRLRPLNFAVRHCLRRAVGPTAAAAIASLLATGLQRPGDLGTSHGANSLWLQTPPFVAAVACTLAAIEYWPTFARQRPGADLVRRSAGAPLFGCGTAVLGSLCALALLLLPLAAITALQVPVPRAHHALTAAGRPLLDEHTDALQFAVGGIDCAEIRLRPVALLPSADPVPTTVAVVADGVALLTAPVEFAATRQLVRVPADRSIGELTLRRTAGTLPLLFDVGACLAVERSTRDRFAGSACALGLYLLPAFAALALALLLAPWIGLPVTLVAVATTLAILTFTDLGTAATGIALAARGHWVPAEHLLSASFPSLAAGLLAMIAAMLVRARIRR